MKVGYLVAVAVVGCSGVQLGEDESGSGGGIGGGPSGSGGGGQASGVGGGAQVCRDELTGGTRLKVRSLVAADGARQQSEFWDSARNETCIFNTASDGKMRCLPITGFGVAQGPLNFADAQCSVPAFVSAYCTSAKYALKGAIASCIYQYELHTVVPISTIYSLSGTTCAQAQIPTGSYYFRSTGIIDPTAFVEATYVIEP